LQKGERELTSQNAAKAKQLIGEFAESRIIPKAEVNAQWHYLKYHAEMCRIYADLLNAHAVKDEDAKIEYTEKLRKYVRDNELEIHNVFDPFFFEWMFNSFLKNL